MINLSFSLKYRGSYISLERVNKTKARNLFNDGFTIYVIPCKMAPSESPFSMLFDYNIEREKNGPSFDNWVNNVTYYNCNSETGQYLAFYINEYERQPAFEFHLLDHCYSDYFRGHHLPVLQVPVYGNMTAGQVLESIQSELSEGYANYPDLQTDIAIKAFRAKYDLRKIFVTDERDDKSEDSECTYLFFVLGRLERDRVMPGINYVVNPHFDN